MSFYCVYSSTSVAYLLFVLNKHTCHFIAKYLRFQFQIIFYKFCLFKFLKFIFLMVVKFFHLKFELSKFTSSMLLKWAVILKKLHFEAKLNEQNWKLNIAMKSLRFRNLSWTPLKASQPPFWIIIIVIVSHIYLL